MNIITDNQTLLSLVPNVEITVEGERTLYDKINSWLVMAEHWVSYSFTGDAVLAAIAADPSSTVWHQVATLIAHEALRRAIPHLDLVLTPNGFGVVSNQMVAPASKERVERLIASCRAQRDHSMELLLASLTSRPEWQSTSQRAWFNATLLQSPRDCVEAVYGSSFTGDRWEAFLQLRDAARVVEAEIAEKWVSEALMVRLRAALSAYPMVADDVSLALHVRRCVLDELAGKPRNRRALDRVVNYVRQQPEEYPEWASSDTARLFDPPVFRNEKNSKGFFF